MPPLMRFWFNLHRHNKRPLKDRNMHKLERIAYFWPMFWYIRLKGRRLKPEQTIEPATAGFFMPKNETEEP